MAGDWIKMRASLCTNPKVLMIAEIIGGSTDVGRRMSTGFTGTLSEIVTSDVTRDITIGGLLRVWCATNEHTVDGVWHNSTLKVIDQVAGIPGFGDAMASAGWAVFDAEEGTVTMPNFLENNAPAKNNARSSSAERQARYREKKKAKSSEVTPADDVTQGVTRDVTSNAREEKRREEVNTSSLRSESASEEGLATKAMRTAGLQDANPSHPLLTKLLAEGVTVDELVYAASETVRRGKGFAYALTMAAGRREDAAKLQVGKPPGRRMPPPENFENKNYGQGVELV
ncbi:hypothetical protein E8K88_11870 [Lampropedia aestuarii]|uniref:Uncharacterized protein n=1 Tax=Lampropedia aestuarii TaxID=2562762 RepID=A0A4V3YWS4_9BURK|nr:hypothetical protein [Lampropedia aestuarii]THJ32392.1 hypothetical protein E8K88_11870 [Lampropedia aestuarii]